MLYVHSSLQGTSVMSKGSQPSMRIIRLEPPSFTHYVPVTCSVCKEEDALNSCKMNEIASACPVGAMHYGDLNGGLGELIRVNGNRVFTLGESIYYIAKSEEEAEELKRRLLFTRDGVNLHP